MYESQGRYGEAESLLRKALQVREDILGKEHPSTLISLNNLAFLYSRQTSGRESTPNFAETVSYWAAMTWYGRRFFNTEKTTCSSLLATWLNATLWGFPFSICFR